MDKVKIQEIADEAGLSNGDLLEKAKELGFDVNAANSAISLDDAVILVDYAISGTLPKGFKKAGTKKKIQVVKKKVDNSKVPLGKGLDRGLGEILSEVEKSYENDVKLIGLQNTLNTFFNDIYRKNIHISCLELPILKILLTNDDWFTRDEII